MIGRGKSFMYLLMEYFRDRANGMNDEALKVGTLNVNSGTVNSSGVVEVFQSYGVIVEYIKNIINAMNDFDYPKFVLRKNYSHLI